MAIILAFSISFYILYHEQVYNLLLFSLILISVYQARAGNISPVAFFTDSWASAHIPQAWIHSFTKTSRDYCRLLGFAP